MATRLEYRTAVERKLIALEDSGYGDFEYSATEYNTYLELAVARLFPALYTKTSLDNQTVASYGTNTYSRVAVGDIGERIFLVVESDEQEPVFGWRIVGSYLSHLDMNWTAGIVDVHYYDAYVLPSDDTTDAGIPAVWTPLIVLGALIEALESRQDSGVRGDEPPVGNNVEIPLLDRLLNRYDALKDDLALSLPVVTV